MSILARQHRLQPTPGCSALGGGRSLQGLGGGGQWTTHPGVLSSLGLLVVLGLLGASGSLQEICRSALFCAARVALQPAWAVRAISGRYHAQSHIFLSDQSGRTTAEITSVGHRYKQPEQRPWRAMPESCCSTHCHCSDLQGSSRTLAIATRSRCFPWLGIS